MSTAPDTAVEPLTSVVARRVRGLRAELGLRQADLGTALGMSTVSISERLRGETKFDINELPALAHVLGTSIEYLLGLTDVRSAPSGATLTGGYLSPREAPVVDLAAYRLGRDRHPSRARLPHQPRPTPISRPRPDSSERVS